MLLSQNPINVLLIADLLRLLIGPKVEGSFGALQHDTRTKPAKDNSLVVFTRKKVCYQSVSIAEQR